ncbi:MAG: hypothetical protein ACK4ZW_06035 [Blastomonas sp.]
MLEEPFVWALWSDDGRDILKTSDKRFDGAVKFYTPPIRPDTTPRRGTQGDRDDT